MRIFTLLIIAVSILSPSVGITQTKLKTGQWKTEMQINDSLCIPFTLHIQKSKQKQQFNFIIENGEERIEFNNYALIDDSFRLQFQNYSTALVLHPSSSTSLEGYFINHNKKDYIIPIKAVKTKEPRFTNTSNQATPRTVSGKWETTFEPGTPSAYPALGVFEQTKDKLTGTFLTETGDYRFLEGNIYGDNLYLSTFDGSHAFLFTGKILQDGTIAGHFFSGKHWYSTWTAKANEAFELADPEAITYLKSEADSTLRFSLNTTSNETFNFPNDQYNGKVVIIQLMGTWCPNCTDETIYFRSLYDNYHAQGLEIISVGYESGNDFNVHAARLNAYKAHFKLDHQFLVGGTAGKKVAAEQFPMLSGISSFPTTLFVDKQGIIRKIHTGFSGPGTGSYFEEYKETTEAFIQMLLAE